MLPSMIGRLNPLGGEIQTPFQNNAMRKIGMILFLRQHAVCSLLLSSLAGDCGVGRPLNPYAAVGATGCHV